MGGQVFTKAIIANVGGFTGTFDGNDHKITNFTINGGSNSYVGLFGYINSYSSSVKNLGLENCSVSGLYFVGGLAGFTYGNITNCYSTGSVSGASSSGSVGGLVGESDGNITNCYSTGSVSGASSSGSVGGLVGLTDYGSIITNCYSTGSVSAGSNSKGIGGLMGVNQGGISNCYSTGSVSGASGSEYVGGLVGFNNNINNNSSISNCYSTSAVSGSAVIGGLVGYHLGNGNISNCYSTGAVTGSQILGGLVGYNSGASVDVNGCFWDINTSGQTNSKGGTGKTTTQMKTLSTFTSAGWDFTNETANGTNDYWRMCVDGVNYPQLNWGYAQYGDFACPDGAGMEDLTYFVQRWLESDCTYANNNDCGGTDMDASGTVDFKDFAIFAANWLTGE